MAERFRAKTLVDALSQGGADTDAAAPADLLSRRANAIAAINRASDDRIRGRPAPPISSLLAELDVINAEIADAAAGGERVFDNAPLDAATMRELHGPGDVTLVYFLGPDADAAEDHR